MELIPVEYLDFAASGLKDTTRIAASHPGLWRDIFLTNRKAILKTLREFEKSLWEFKRLLISQDERRLYRFLLKAKTKREGLG
jgi:prephenate dehydrogenase